MAPSDDNRINGGKDIKHQKKKKGGRPHPQFFFLQIFSFCVCVCVLFILGFFSIRFARSAVRILQKSKRKKQTTTMKEEEEESGAKTPAPSKTSSVFRRRPASPIELHSRGPFSSFFFLAGPSPRRYRVSRCRPVYRVIDGGEGGPWTPPHLRGVLDVKYGTHTHTHTKKRVITVDGR